MIELEEFYKKVEAQLEASEEHFVSSNAITSGWLVCINGEYAVVDEEFDGVFRLPIAINTQKLALSYIGSLDDAFLKGEKRGRENMRNQIASVLGFAKKEYVDHLDARTNERIDNSC